MNIEDFRLHCIQLPGVTESFPFDNKTLVFKVMGKMFALTDVDNFESINLKCDPAQAIELRETYSEVKPGYHMSKKHWNTVSMNGNIPNQLLIQWINDSYNLVVQGLTKQKQNELKSLK